MKKNTEVRNTQRINKNSLPLSIDEEIKAFLLTESKHQGSCIEQAECIINSKRPEAVKEMATEFKNLAMAQVKRINLLLYGKTVALNVSISLEKIFEYLLCCEKQHARADNLFDLKIFLLSSSNETSIGYALERHLRQDQSIRSSLAHLKEELAFFKKSENTFDHYLNNLPSQEEKAPWLVLQSQANAAINILSLRIAFFEEKRKKPIERDQSCSINENSIYQLERGAIDSFFITIQDGLNTLVEARQGDIRDKLLNDKKRKPTDVTETTEAYSDCFFLRQKRLCKGELLDLLITRWNVPEGSCSNGEFCYDEPPLSKIF